MARRSVLLAGLAAVLAGCATRGPITLDREAMVGIKRIGLPTVGTPRSPDVDVVNSIGKRMAGFGLIGAIGNLSGSIVRGNRSDALAAILAAQHVAPGPDLTAMLAADLTAKGFTVVPMPAPASRRFLPTIANSPDYDAVLDCYIGQYGFIALDDFDDAPYRATVVVPSRLVGSGGTVLMQDSVIVSAHDPAEPAPPGPASGNPAPPRPLAPGTFRSFSDVEKDPASGAFALRAVLQAAADGVVRRIT